MDIIVYIFEVKGSDRIVILVIRGQLLARRSHKGHLRLFSLTFQT